MRKKFQFPKKKQSGGISSDLTLIEKGEIYKDPYGNIKESFSFSHDDPLIEGVDDNVIINPEDGGEVVDAQSVASASYDYVKSGDRKETKKEKALAFKSKDASKLFHDRGYSWFKSVNKTMSPSELIKEGIKQASDYYLSNDGSNDQYSKNSQKLNLQQMPSDEEIYDLVFEEQERKKTSSGYDYNEEASIAKSGIRIKPENRGKFNATKKRTGKTTEELTHSKNPLTRKRAIFAQNAKKWKKGQYGGSTYVERRPVRPAVVKDAVDLYTPDIYRSLTGDKDARFTEDVNAMRNKTLMRDQELADLYESNDDDFLLVKDTKYNKRHNQKVNKLILNDIINASIKSGVDPYTALSIAQRESGIGESSQKKHVDRDRDFYPAHIFSNWARSEAGLTKEELGELDTQDSFMGDKPLNPKLFNKFKQYNDMTNKYPFAAEMDTIKRKGIKGYNPGDKDYSNQVAREREILFSDENKPFRDYVDERIRTYKKQYGGEIPTSLDGLYEYPDQPVVVPSGDITMEGINYPVDAYDANTGQYLDTMQPDMNYNFNTNKVLEIPKAQSGGDRRAHYQKLLDDARSKFAKYDAAFKNAKSPSEKELARINREEAQNSINYLENNPNLKPETQYTGNKPWNPLEGIPEVATPPITPVDNTQPGGFRPRTPINIPNGGRPSSSSSPSPTSSRTRGYAQYTPDNLGEDGTYTVGQGDWLSAIASNNGLTLDQLLAANPQIADKNKIDVGDKINIPRTGVAAVDNTPSTSRIEDINIGEIDSYGEMMKDGDLTYEMLINQPAYPDVDPNVVTKRVNDGKLKDAADAALNAPVSLGRLNRRIGTNALREMMRANRSINLPYRPEVPNRTLGYNEIDATPYLDEIDSAVNQQLQYVNQNTSQGQAILNNVLSRASGEKRQILNRIGSANLQQRRQIDNANTQLLNQYDLMQEQNNANYVEGVNQTLAAYDRNRVQQADYLDQLINMRSREDNDMLRMAIKYGNFKIDPNTGEVVRVRTEWNKPSPPPVKNAAKWGMKRRSC